MTGADEPGRDEQVTGGAPSGRPVPPGRACVPEVALEPVREQMRRQMLNGFGGISGMVVSAVPTVVFIAVNAASTLRVAVLAALASALALTGYRLARRQSVQQALSGLFGVLLAAIIAGRTGQARGYFLLGIWSSALYGAAFLGSMLVRRPLVGAVWEFLDPTPSPRRPQPPSTQPPSTQPVPTQPVPTPSPTDDATGLPWHRRTPLARAYYWATAAGTAVFAARAIVQGSLFEKNATGWLAVTRIAMGYPLTIAAAGFGWFVVRRARRRLAADEAPGT